MSDLKELCNLRDRVNKKFNCDITIKCRERHVVYARKVYCKLATRLNKYFTLQQIGEAIGLQHDNVIYHLKTFHSIYDHHKKGYIELGGTFERSKKAKRKDAIKLALYYRKKLNKLAMYK